ncbi:MAG: DMT family transporter [Alphaproteobacteria bacterium]|nr:DMT family transporter [Alphaproteobacteria bacterium]
MSATIALPTRRLLRDSGADTIRGIALITVCYLLMAFSDVLVKYALPMAGLTAAILFRGTIGAATVLAITARNGRQGLARLRPVRTGLVLLRSILQAVVGITWFAAWESMALADSYAVGFATPLIATLAAVVLLGERLDWPRALGTLFGFAGVIIMLRPDGNLWNPAMPMLLTGIIASAFARLMTRTLSTTETPECLAFSLLLMHLPVALCMLWFIPMHAIPLPALAALLVLGLLSGVSQMMNARAYALAPVSALGPFDYSSMIWAVALGWLCFGETPNVAAMQGAVVIALAGLYSLHSEQRRRGREKGAA